MKIQCSVCEAAEAKVICCADEAALCLGCDEKVHAANKLAGKHQRMALTGTASSQIPKCDICQEASGYFFCLEDRALLCQECDMSIHSMNVHVSAHRRFLLTGVKVEADHPMSTPSSFTEHHLNPSMQKPLSQRRSSTTYSGEIKEENPVRPGWSGNQLDGAHLTGGLVNLGISEWQLDHFFGAEFRDSHGFTLNQSSKGDNGKLGSSEGTPTCRQGSDEPEVDSVNQVPEVQWTVPQIHAPPMASGLNWFKNSLFQNPVDQTAFVPDVCTSSCQDSQPSSSIKRQR